MMFGTGLLAFLESIGLGGVLLQKYTTGLTQNLNYFHPPGEKKSFLDSWFKRQAGRPRTAGEKRLMQMADRLARVVRKVSQYQSFRYAVRGVCLAHSPLRRMLGKGAGPC
jgi:hypothetical protein